MPEAANDATRQGGFPRAEIAFEKNQAVAGGDLRDAGAKLCHGLFVRHVQGYFRHGECSSNN
ncbi:hypothetical protein D3C75_1356820 [compost metagenome]